MANSLKPGPLGRDPFHLCPYTGPLGINYAASPFAPTSLVGDTPGPVGCSNDYAALEADSSLLGLGSLHVTISLDKDLLLWDYDPDHLLDEPGLNPRFVRAAHQSLASAVRSGLRPKVHEAHRTPEKSGRKNQIWKGGGGHRAGAAWRSCHNYGVAMDVYLYDSKNKKIDYLVKGWHKQYKHLAKSAIAAGFVWGESFKDANHFEFHPNWRRGLDGPFLLRVKAWAQQAAISRLGASTLANGEIGPVPSPSLSESEWMPFLWWAAGTGGNPPSAAFLASNHPPELVAPAKHSGSK